MNTTMTIATSEMNLVLTLTSRGVSVAKIQSGVVSRLGVMSGDEAGAHLPRPLTMYSLLNREGTAWYSTFVSIGKDGTVESV